MCVIIVKSKKESLPKKENLKNCFDRNPDGAGFMYCDNNGKVIIDKGYMNFKSFYSHYKKLCKKYNNFKNKNLVMHMRISTAGGVKPQNTHPFPLTNNFGEMKKTYNKCEIGLVHNGIISATNPTKEQEKKGINDTMLFIKQYINPIYREWENCFKSKEFLAGILNISGSKFAIIDNKDNLYTIGKFEKYDGNFYSNDSYVGYNYQQYFKNYSYNYDLYDSYYTDEYFEESNKQDEETIKEYEGMIFCEDSDLVALNNDYEYIEIEQLRTQDNSMFIYNTENMSLTEISETGEEVLNIFYDCVLVSDYQF